MKRKNLKKILIVILIISVISLISLIIYDYYEMKKTDKELSDIVENFDKKINNNDNIDSNENIVPTEEPVSVNESVVIDGLNVFGKIKIEKINIEYPVLEYKDENSLWKSVCKISENKIDGTGNLCIAGHNMRNETMFTRLKELELGDKIEITNINNEKFIYEVFENKEVSEYDVDILNNTEEPIVTLITCKTFDYSKRVIIKGKLISDEN